MRARTCVVWRGATQRQCGLVFVVIGGRRGGEKQRCVACCVCGVRHAVYGSGWAAVDAAVAGRALGAIGRGGLRERGCGAGGEMCAAASEPSQLVCSKITAPEAVSACALCGHDDDDDDNDSSCDDHKRLRDRCERAELGYTEI